MEIRRRSGSRGRRRVAVVLSFVGAALVLAPGCSGELQLSQYSGTGVLDGGGTGNPDAPPNFDFDGAPKPRACNLGPEAGVCTCLDVPLLVDVPNIYFVLDRSGSMQQSNKLVTAEVVIAHAVLKLGPRINVGLAVFPDPFNSDVCGAGRELMSVRGGDAPAGSTGSTYAALVNTLVRLSAAGGTPTASTLAALLPRVSGLSGRTYVILATDGGPNCDDRTSCTVDQCIANIESAAPGCAPNVAPNCCDNAHYGPLSCLDATATITAVTAYKNANIPVYVIGVSGSGAYATLLDQLAQAGGTARSTSPFYYRVDGVDEGSFQQALFQVAAKIVASCTLELKEAPTDPNLVNVFFDGVAVPQAGPDGWNLQGSTITLVGASCDKVLAGDVLDVNVSGGCPTVIH